MKEKEKRLNGLGPAHNEASPTARIQLRLKKKPPGEAHSDLDILHQNPDIFQKLLRFSHLFFFSSIFTARTPYFFLFFSLLLISVGNESETEPVIGGGRINLLLGIETEPPTF
jgi:hypothetical protein